MGLFFWTWEIRSPGGEGHGQAPDNPSSGVSSTHSFRSTHKCPRGVTSVMSVIGYFDNNNGPFRSLIVPSGEGTGDVNMVPLSFSK